MDISLYALRSKLGRGVLAIGLAAGLCGVIGAGAQNAYADSADTTGYITCSSYRAAEPAPEILGLSNLGSNTAWSGLGELDWSAPYYYIFGTDRNSNPNPYMVNTVSNWITGTSDASPTMVYYNRQGGPTAAMYAYKSGNDDGSDAVWQMLPDTILGTGSGVDYSDADYAPAVAKDLGIEEYNPTGVAYDSTNIYTMITSMYNLAAAADEIDAADDTKTLRYGNATAIAKEYEEYVIGTQGYVLEQLATDNATKKTVALVNNYDAESNTYSIIPTGVPEGTAAANRYLEAVQAVATNIADDGRETTTTGSGRNQTTVATATAEEIANVDLILIGSQSGSETLTSTEGLLDTFTAEMQQKTYWVTSDNGSAGSTYGVVMNSVENAQNIGRILGCLYPEYIDQDQWIAYYYDNFYHLTTGSLASTIDNAMDGVRNWDADSTSLTSWTEADASDYNASAVKSTLLEGMRYVSNNSDKVPSYLVISSNYGEVPEAELTAKPSFGTEKIRYTGEALTPEFTVEQDGTTLVQGTDYTWDGKYYSDLACTQATEVVDAGLYYVKIEGTGKYYGTKKASVRIYGANLFAEGKVTVGDESGWPRYTGLACTAGVTVTANGVTLVEGVDYTWDHKYYTDLNCTQETEAIERSGDSLYYVKVEGIGNYSGPRKASFKVRYGSLFQGSIDAIASHVYDGKTYAPVPVVKNSAGITLTEGVDYTYAYYADEGCTKQVKTPTIARNYFVKATAVDGSDYLSFKKKMFTITAS